MATIFGNKKTFESQWKKIYKKRTPKRGTSELLRNIDAGMKPQDYDRIKFLEDVLSRKSDAERFVKGLESNKKKIEDQYKKFKDWTDKEKEFFIVILRDIEMERVFWSVQVKKMT